MWAGDAEIGWICMRWANLNEMKPVLSFLRQYMMLGYSIGLIKFAVITAEKK